MNKLTPCRICGNHAAKSARTCNSCGVSRPDAFNNMGYWATFSIFAVPVLFLLTTCAVGIAS